MIFLGLIILPAALILFARDEKFKMRFGIVQPLPKAKYILVHCASIGEINLSKLFIQKLKDTLPEYKMLLSVITPTGYKYASSFLPVERVFFLPVDFYFFVRNFLRRIRPEVLVLVETELWPNLIYLAKKFRIKIVLVNGRISNKTFRFYQLPLLNHLFFSRFLNKIDLCLMREKVDFERIIKLGIDKNKVLLTGNMKYDQINQSPLATYHSEFGFETTDKIFTAGSIREGEERGVIEAYYEAVKKVPELKFIIAPRHLNRIRIIERLLNQKNISYIHKSLLNNLATQPHCHCLILDTFGELIKAYQISDIVFVGGSLLPYGGQNIIEPASLGKVVIFGPYMSNFAEPAEVLLKNNAAIQVKDITELKNVIIDFFVNPVKYRLIPLNATAGINQLKGATERNISCIKSLLLNPQV